jgi:hypothetical protein
LISSFTPSFPIPIPSCLDIVYSTPENLQKYKYVVLERERQKALEKDHVEVTEPTLMEQAEQAATAIPN